MKNWVSGLLIVILLAVAATLIYFNFIHKGEEKKETVSVVEERIEVKEPSSNTYELKNRIAQLEKRVSKLEEKGAEKVVSAPRPQPVREAPREQPRPRPEPKPEPKPETPRRADMTDLSHIRDVNGDIIFCVMANNDPGMHFPQYALDKGVRFEAVSANTTRDGNNWIVSPVSQIDGDYGVTSDGTFFVSHEVLQSTMSEDLHTLQIKSGFTAWQARNMKYENGYWIYKTK